MTARYWLVKAPAEFDVRHGLEIEYGWLDFEIVEVVPEHRDSNWVERAIAARFAKEHPAE
jgi:hypothetical protein